MKPVKPDALSLCDIFPILASHPRGHEANVLSKQWNVTEVVMLSNLLSAARKAEI
jgi:hypothetical protein